MSACSTCGAPIWWAVTEAGKGIPIDAEPRPDGNMVLGDKGMRPHLPLFDDDAMPRYVSHFATCPQADQHRRTR